MGLIMMSIMHFVIERTVSCHPYGVHRTCDFVGRRCWRSWGSWGSRGSRGLHSISSPFSIRRPYGTVSHGVTKEIRRVMKRSEIPAYNNRVMRIPAYNNRVMQIPTYNNRDNHAINHTEIPQKL